VARAQGMKSAVYPSDERVSYRLNPDDAQQCQSQTENIRVCEWLHPGLQLVETPRNATGYISGSQGPVAVIASRYLLQGELVEA